MCRKSLLFMLVFLSVLVLGPAAGTANAALVAHWTFDESGGNTAYDLVGGNHAAVHGAEWTTGKIGGALSFDGVGDYLRIPDSDILDITGDLTIEAWIKTSQTSDYSRIFSNLPEVSPHNGYALEITSWEDYNGQIRFYSQESCLLSIGRINTGTWKHVRVTLSGTVATIYIDSIFDSSGNVNVPNANDVDQMVGASSMLSYFFDGVIDDIRVYDHVVPEPATFLLLGLGGLVLLRKRNWLTG